MGVYGSVAEDFVACLSRFVAAFVSAFVVVEASGNLVITYHQME